MDDESQKVWEGVSYALVARLLNGLSACSDRYYREERKLFFKDHGLKEPVVFVSGSGFGPRYVEKEEGARPLSFGYNEDYPIEGWDVYREVDVWWIQFVSATSGSRLTAEKITEGYWRVYLHVPFRKGAPYKGIYWERFHRILGVKE